MSATEIAYWENKTEFLGYERLDYLFGRLEATVCNMSGKVLNDNAQVSPLDCMAFSKKGKRKAKSERELSEDEIAQRVHAIFGGLVQKGK